jgi:CcmD family protein
MEMLPLVIVAVLIWLGVFLFTLFVDRKIAEIEKRLEERENRRRKENE